MQPLPLIAARADNCKIAYVVWCRLNLTLLQKMQRKPSSHSFLTSSLLQSFLATLSIAASGPGWLTLLPGIPVGRNFLGYSIQKQILAQRADEFGKAPAGESKTSVVARRATSPSAKVEIGAGCGRLLVAHRSTFR